MSYSDDHFSVDDILNEVNQHHSHDGSSSHADADLLIDEILKERTEHPAPARKSADVPFQLHIRYDDDDSADTESSDDTAARNTTETPKTVIDAAVPSVKETDSDVQTDREPAAPAVSPSDNDFMETTYHSGLQAQPDDAYRTFRENREKKIKGFVLMGNETEVDNEEAETDDENAEDKVIEEFDSMEDAPSVLADIKELMTSLSVRFGIMLVLLIMNLYLNIMI